MAHLGSIQVTDNEMQHLVQAVGDFGLGMLRAFVSNQDQMTSEAHADFDAEVKIFTAKVGEFFPIETLIQQILMDELEADSEAA